MKNVMGALLVVACAACAQEPSNTAATAANEAAVKAACKDPHVQCSDQAITLKLHFSDGHSFTQVIQPPIPLVQYDRVFLFPGQTLFVEADDEDGKLVHLRVVPENIHPEKTLIIDFEQSGSNGGEGMMLSIHQPFDRWLKYHAQVMDFDVPGAAKQTSTCPVVPKGGAYETWPEPITQVMLGDFHLVDQDSKEAGQCAY